MYRVSCAGQAPHSLLADHLISCPPPLLLVVQGSARVIRCLQDNRNKLSSKCTAAFFDHEVRMAEDIDFKYPLKKSCSWEMSNFCKDIPHGPARVIRWVGGEGGGGLYASIGRQNHGTC